MYKYVYEANDEEQSVSLRHFFTSHPDPEIQRIINFARFFAFEVFVVFSLLLVHAYSHLSVQTVQASIVSPVDEAVEAVTLPTQIPSPHPTFGPTSTPRPTISPTETPRLIVDDDLEMDKDAIPYFGEPTKKTYIIALYGDSLVDTMGEVGEYLEHAMKKRYPHTNFLIYNYGVGSQNARDGLARFNKRLDYQSRHYPSITEINADVIVMGSFGYNVYTPHDRNQHWLDLTRLVQAAQKTSADVYMLAEIAPLRGTFGVGPHGVNWETDTVYKHSGHIIEQLENAIGLAATLKVPLIDAFTPSKLSGRDEGQRELINTDDGIHPSQKGHEFMAEKIADRIRLK